MRIVLDASALIAGVSFEGSNTYFITKDILNEIRDEGLRLRLDLSIEEGALTLKEPDKEFISAIKMAVGELGEDGHISKADIGPLAVALEMKESKGEVLLATDDYGIQNVASHLNIPFKPISEKGIKKRIVWHYICTGCGRIFNAKTSECNVCGSKVKRRATR